MHMLSPVTDNCPSWINGRERMTVEIVSWPISTKECCRTQGSNPRPSAYLRRMRIRQRYRTRPNCLFKEIWDMYVILRSGDSAFYEIWRFTIMRVYDSELRNLLIVYLIMLASSVFKTRWLEKARASFAGQYNLYSEYDKLNCLIVWKHRETICACAWSKSQIKAHAQRWKQSGYLLVHSACIYKARGKEQGKSFSFTKVWLVNFFVLNLK